MIPGSRRRFLAWLAAGSAAVGVTAARCGGYRLPDAAAAGLKVLEPWQYLVIDAVGRRILDPERADVAAFADEYAVALPADDLRDLIRFVGYVEYVGPLSIGRVKRFTSLSKESQDFVLLRVETSHLPLLRAGFQGLKALAVMAHYRRDESFEPIGYGGPVVDWSEL